MVEKQSVIGLPEKVGKTSRSNHEVVSCESSALGKQAKKTFTLSSRKRAETVGERVHVDICGPIGVQTVGGKFFFVLFKDEYSNFRTVHFIKSKDEAHDRVRKCVAQIKADTKNDVRKLMSDRGSEFTSKRTQAFLLDNGTVHETSAPFTPQQNGLIQRDNRTVMESARSMLFHKNLPETLWGQAVSTAVYLLNRSPNRVTNFVMPYELYFGTKPNVSHIRVFGSLTFMKLQEKKRSGYQKKL